jgi:hypothetical protein
MNKVDTKSVLRAYEEWVKDRNGASARSTTPSSSLLIAWSRDAMIGQLDLHSFEITTFGDATQTFKSRPTPKSPLDNA